MGPRKLPAPEDLELVSALINMKAGRTSPISVLPPLPKLPTDPLPVSIPESHSRNKPPCNRHHASPSVPSYKRVQARQQGQQPARYTAEQRQIAVQRYKNKKLTRGNPKGQIRYEVRKRLADTRPRHRGRFFKPKQDGEQAETPQRNM